jgi:hypothetical protein
MYSSKISNNLIYKLDFINNNDLYNFNIKNERSKLYRKILNLNSKLNVEKNKINKYYENNCVLWDKLKKFSNEYEFVYTSSMSEFKNISMIYPISRSYFKLWEILHDFKYLLNIDNNDGTLFKTAHIAEGPGGFIECIYKYICSYYKDNIFNKIKIYGLTLLSDDINIPNWKIKKNNIKSFNIELNRRYQGNGDLYDIENINNFINNIGYKSCNFITGDGGFDFSYNYNEQEENFIFFFISEIYLILNLLKKEGNCIIKIYDIYSKNSIKLIYILTLFFNDIYILKPFTSRPANSEKYILCNNYNDDDKLLNYMNILKDIIINKDIKLLNNNNIIIPYNFLDIIYKYNVWYTDRQIKYINKTIDLIEINIENNNEINIENNNEINIENNNEINIENNNEINNNAYLSKLYNSNKIKCIEWCKYYNINYKK